MTFAQALGWFALVVGCTRGTSPSAEASRDAAARSAPVASPSPTPAALSTAVLASLCGADQLPRLDESRAELGALFAAAERGTVAVTLSGARAQTLPACLLPGAYTEVNGTGGGRFFATERVLLRTDEVKRECRSGTHLVAAYVTWRDAAVDRIAAILVPLPCPSASDPAPAPGCVGAGLTGPERVERAKPLAERLIANEARKPMVLEALTAFALVPDEAFTLEALGQGFSRDSALTAQETWLLLQYVHVQDRVNEPPRFVLKENPAPPPRMSWQASLTEPLYGPVFLYCFLDHFTPDSPWTPAERKRVP